MPKLRAQCPRSTGRLLKTRIKEGERNLTKSALGPDGSMTAFTQMPRLIDAIGATSFGDALITLLAELCHADHCTIFKITEQSPFEVIAMSRDGTDTAYRQSKAYLSGSYWRHDTSMTDAMASVGAQQTTIYHSETRSISNHELRDRIYTNAHVRERILLCGGTEDQFIGISILRDDHACPLSNNDLAGLQALSDTLVAIVSKHVSLVEHSSNFSLALTSLGEIEATINASSVKLPKREAEVCARILYGISSAGIALDLDIGEETVATYRKRTYQRLGIATQRELLIWYIREWGNTRGRYHQYGTQLIHAPEPKCYLLEH
jgi:DNA-binding CsgD family transcriptional regulator